MRNHILYPTPLIAFEMSNKEGVAIDTVRGFRCSLSLLVEEGICLPLVLWQESGPNFKGLPKVSGVATNHWVFLKFDWSPVSS